jgi:hypothetical protein
LKVVPKDFLTPPHEEDIKDSTVASSTIEEPSIIKHIPSSGMPSLAPRGKIRP